MRFALVHSPLVGPRTWTHVADELRARGHHAVVASVEDAPDCDVLVGHSGAGPWLPIIAARFDASPALVFVDAGVPPVTGEARLVPDDLFAHLASLAVDGVLPRWSDWFGPDLMKALVPDADERNALIADMPQLPLSYFEQVLCMPPNWTDTRCGYVLLSDPYRHDSAASRERGWSVVERMGTHLDIVTRPADVAKAVLQVSQIA